MKRIATTALTAAALLAVPASSMAADTFGSRLANEPTEGSCKNLVAPCTYVAFIHPSAPNGDPYSGGAPKDGVITKFRIRALGPGASVTFRLAELTATPNAPSALAKAAGTGPTVQIKGTVDENNNVPIEEFAGRLPVKRGDQLAIDTSTADAIYNSDGSKRSYVYAPSLVQGQGMRGSSDVTNELLVQGVIEPDADRDGFGDETQDPFVGRPRDTVKPRLARVGLKQRAFKGSTSLRYSLSEAAKVTFRVEKKKGKRYVRVAGKVVRNAKAGRNSLKLGRRFAGRKLKPGRYRLVMRAADTAGNKSAVKRLGFRVKR